MTFDLVISILDKYGFSVSGWVAAICLFMYVVRLHRYHDNRIKYIHREHLKDHKLRNDQVLAVVQANTASINILAERLNNLRLSVVHGG